MRALIFLLLFCLNAAVSAADAPLYPGKHAVDGRSLLAGNDVSILLGGLEVPPSQKVAAKAALDKKVAGKLLRLQRLVPTADRHGRLIAAVYDEKGQLLQIPLLEEGLALWDGSEASAPIGNTLLEAEKKAEKAKRGIWKTPFMRKDTEAAKAMGQFAIVEGVVQEVSDHYGRIYINFGKDWKTDFTLMVADGHRQDFDPTWLASLTGGKVRGRGFVFKRNGSAIELYSPKQVEILP